jgi:hypothetical protein
MFKFGITCATYDSMHFHDEIRMLFCFFAAARSQI